MLFFLLFSIFRTSEDTQKEWVFNEGGTDLTVTCLKEEDSNPMDDYSSDSSSPAFEHRDTLESVTINCSTVGNYAFKGCSVLKSVFIISDEFTKIGDNAFEDCYSIETFSFSDQDTSFDGESTSEGDTTEIDIFNLETIGNSAFQNSRLPSKFDLPSTVTSIGQSAFKNCSGIQTITISSGINTIAESTFQGCPNLQTVTLPESLISIGESAFENCQKLLTVTLPSTFASIGNNAFKDCIAITTLNFPQSITSIGNSAFMNCDSIQSITIPSSETQNTLTIGNNAFSNCDKLETIIFGKSITSFGQTIFDQCTKLQNVTFGDITITEPDALLPDTLFQDCKALVSVTFGDITVKIPDALFQNCGNLQNVKIEHTLEDLSGALFESCENLQSFTYAQDYGTISSTLFANHKKLISVEFQGTVSIISDTAFQNCEALETVKVAGLTGSIGQSVFSGCSSLSELEIGNQNTNYFVENQVLYCKEQITPPETEPTEITSIYYYLPLKQDDEYEIPYYVTNIYQEAFYKCKFLQNIIFSQSVTLSESSFLNCEALTTITLNAKIQVGVSSAFQECKYLKRINLNYDNVNVDNDLMKLFQEFSNITFSKPGVSIGDNGFFNNQKLVELVFDFDGECTIGKKAFSECHELQTVRLPRSLETIPEGLFYSCTGLTNLILLDSITTIEKQAFYDCTNLNTNIPNNIKKIGNQAFYNCKLSDELTLSSSLSEVGSEAFAYNEFHTVKINSNFIRGSSIFDSCSNVQTVIINSNSFPTDIYRLKGQIKYLTLQEKVETIPAQTFYYVTNLIEVRIYSLSLTIGTEAFRGCTDTQFNFYQSKYTILSIGNYAFYNCEKLSSLGSVEKIGSIGNYAFQNCFILSGFGSLKEIGPIGYYAFYGCSDLSGFDSVQKIGSIGFSAFQGCYDLSGFKSLKEIGSIGNSAFDGCRSLSTLGDITYIQSIGASAFQNCEKLLSLGSVKEVGDIWEQAFEGCKGLTSAVISKQMEKILPSTFKGCESLESIEIPSNILTIGESAFEGCICLETVNFIPPTSSNRALRSIRNINTDTEPILGIQTIGDSAFKECGFKVLNLPTTLKSIGSSAFSSCDFLINLTINSKLDDISDCAFLMCVSLTKVEIKDDVNEIGLMSFAYCDNLVEFSYYGTVEPKVGEFAFRGCDELETIQVRKDYSGTEFGELSVSTPTEPPTPPGPSSGVIAAIVICVIVVVGASVFAVYWFVIRQRFNNNAANAEIEPRPDYETDNREDNEEQHEQIDL